MTISETIPSQTFLRRQQDGPNAMVFSRKIIFLNRFFYPDHAATSQLLTDLAFDLTHRGETVHVITSRLRYDNPSALLPKREVINGTQIHRIWTSHFGRHFLPGRAIDYLTFHLSAFFRLLVLAKKEDLVIVKTDPPLLSVAIGPAVWLRRATLITWNQDLFPDVAENLGVRGIGKGMYRILKGLRNLSLRLAAHHVVPGQQMAHRLRDTGIPAQRIHTLHNWSNGHTITPVPGAHNPLRQHWGLADRFVVAYSGNMGRAHEFDTLLKAAQRLHHRKEIVFLFIGGGAGLEKVAATAHAHHLDTILFQPYQPRENLSFSLSVADVHWISLRPTLEGLIVPSKFYGILAAGRPVIHVGDVAGEIPALLQEGACGVAISMGEDQQLAQQIAAWADDPALCQRMGNNARHFFEARFDQPMAMTAWYRLIQKSRQQPGEQDKPG